MTNLRVFAILAALTLFHLCAQTFEVASVKPSRGGGSVEGGCHGIDTVLTPTQKTYAAPLGRCVITDARLSHLVSIAWQMQTMQMIESGPDWIQRGMERFDVQAKAEDSSKTTEAQLLIMLQNLLIDRFQMKFHWRPAETSGFALTVDKKGPRLTASKADDSDLSLGGQGKPQPNQPVALRATRFSMPMLIRYLSAFGGLGPGIDKTGLDGVYDFSLAWDDQNGTPLPAAVREQLGLRIELQKVPVSYFIIDSAERPSAN